MIGQKHLDVWVWLGDVVYADDETIPFISRSNPIQIMKQIYDKQKENPHYKRYKKKKRIYENTLIFGTDL